jgi:acyl-CoA thioester hydrolase
VTADPGTVPEPGALVWETVVRVRFHEVDGLGHVNNAAYLNYLEQAAIDHATALGVDLDVLRRLGGVFVARRHDITFLQPAVAGDVLRIVTWLGAPRGARVERRYLILRDEVRTGSVPHGGRVVTGADLLVDAALVVRAMTEWVFAGDNGKPRRIPAEIVALFESAGGSH